MAKIMVKCKYCGKQFDRNDPNIEFVKIKNRYAHKSCAENIPDEKKEEEAFWEYVKKLFGPNYDYVPNKKLVEKYISTYHYSYSGMLKTLKWFYEVEKNDPIKANGLIGIIPYVYNDAYDYYFTLYQIQNKNRQASDYTIKKETVKISSPKVWQPPKKLWFEEEEDL